MAKKAKELGALVVGRLKTPGLTFVGGVAGLAMQVGASGSRSWVLRIMVGGKRREMGLGSFPDVTLSDARTRAREERLLADKGRDPIGERRAEKALLRADQALQVTFEQSAGAYIKSHESSWKSLKHAGQWRATLETYAFPTIGPMLVRDINAANVLSVIEPLWLNKNETASRLRGRIETVLDFAASRGQRSGENPARWKGHLDKTLPARSKIAPVEHHAALPLGEVGAFMQQLRKLSGSAARALEFSILCASRSGEVRGATWSEIDLDTGVWTVLGSRMKAGKEHRVPLSTTALELLRALPRIAGEDIVFTAPRGGALSDMSMTAVMRRMGVAAVPHGFRSTFKDWAAERTNYERDLSEMALAHAIDSKVEAAYRRGDMLEKRRPMMQAWAAFIATPEVKGTVTNIHSKTAA